MSNHTICVCGAGTMGSGIAQAVAQSGFSTILYELNPGVLKNAIANINKNLQSLVEKNKLTVNEKDQVLQRLRFTENVTTCKASIFIEAIIERPEAKAALFNQFASFNDINAVFATNTSSLSITAVAAMIKNPERVIGMHFFNPATIMKLVEVINTSYTNQSTTQIIIDLANAMNKTPVICKDSPGFIVNRVARPYYIESLRMAEEKPADISQIDLLLEATGFKMGPFKLMDLIGNDINYAVSCSVFDQLQQPDRLKPSFLQKEKVDSGQLGKKTGKGYYDYPSAATK